MNHTTFEEKYPSKTFGEVEVRRTCEYPYTGKVDKWDNKERDYSDQAQVTDTGWEIYLNHSCDEWVIGGVEAAGKFHKDLAEALEYCHKNP